MNSWFLTEYYQKSGNYHKVKIFKVMFFGTCRRKLPIFRPIELKHDNEGPWIFLFWLSVDKTWQFLSFQSLSVVSYLANTEFGVWSKVDGPKGWKWTVLKVDGRAKVDGLSKSGRSWAKPDGHLSQSGRSRTIVDGLLSQSGRSFD